MSTYYNEFDPYAAQWLRNLIAANLIPNGHVDERSIVDVHPSDLNGYVQCHFFAGIGGWPYALSLAGWPEDEQVWTGSCPCQPLSVAGQRKGPVDERHLWPAFFNLIAQRKPPTIFGEQVASKDGREWLAGVRADLEAMGYACGAADLCSAGVGAPHRRQRIYWMADADDDRGRELSEGRLEISRNNGRWEKTAVRFAQHGRDCLERVGDASGTGLEGQWREYRPRGERHSGLVGLAMQAGVPEWNGPTIAVECSDGSRRISAQPDSFPLAHGVSDRMGRLRAYGNAITPQVAAQFIAASMEAA